MSLFWMIVLVTLGLPPVVIAVASAHFGPAVGWILMAMMGAWFCGSFLEALSRTDESSAFNLYSQEIRVEGVPTFRRLMYTLFVLGPACAFSGIGLAVGLSAWRHKIKDAAS